VNAHHASGPASKQQRPRAVRCSPPLSVLIRCRSAVVRLGVSYRSVTVTEPLHSITCAVPAQPVQHATSWWACL
jgi:hypothetical protein